MMRIRLVLPLLGGLFLLLFTSCDNTTSTVGIDLVGEGAEPFIRELTPTTFEAMSFTDITGTAPRVLVGEVSDPLTGTVTATGYLDFSTGFDAADTSAIVDVALNLVRDYVYGDTTLPVVLDVHDIPETWDAVGARADTTLTIGPSITTATFGPIDSLVTIPLPASWVEANEATLRNPSFNSEFHGFALTASSNTTVVGFDTERSHLRVITAQDTFRYNMATTPRSLSRLVRTNAPLPPEGRVLLQDGTGPVLKVNFTFEDFDDTPLNGAIFRIFVDTLTLHDTPSNFVRPRLQNLQLVRIQEDESIFVVANATLTEDGHYRFSDPAMNAVFQQTFFGENLYEHLEIRIPVNDNSISPTLLFDTASETSAPEILLTISPPGS